MEKKTLWATKDVHDLHESALHFVSFLVETARTSGESALHTLEDLLRSLEDLLKRVSEGVANRNIKGRDLMEALRAGDESLLNDLRAMQLFARKATGGQFAIDKKIKETLATFPQVYVGEYLTPGATMADRVVCETLPAEGAASGGGDVAGSD